MDREAQGPDARAASHQSRQPGREAPMAPAPEFMPRFPGAGRQAGRVALVTGGDSGIGRAVAVLFAREGADPAILYLEEDADARETRRPWAARASRTRWRPATCSWPAPIPPT